MRIMLDTNVLVSILVFDSQLLKEMLLKITDNYTLVLSSYILNELRDVIERKFQNKKIALDIFLSQLPFEMYYISNSFSIDKTYNIRDKNDILILYSAIKSKSNILITGDKDFDNIRLKNIKIMTPREFIDKY